tara:strand:- start:510 stop:989 length:480 start_codon:yes stop_codon:yes gene_type:complete
LKLPKNILAIDPGVTGGYCWNNGAEVYVDKFTTIQETNWMSEFDILYIEKVNSSPQMGKASAFTFGQNYGEWLGLLEGLYPETNIVKVPPQVWQRDYPELRGITGTQRKQSLKKIADDRTKIGWNGIPPQPELKLTLATCDAFLLWAYAMLTETEKLNG